MFDDNDDDNEPDEFTEKLFLVVILAMYIWWGISIAN